ncbi:hypothetical protein ACJMK2_043810 [Sinanodonta woodiana]|uniref:Uncharacterized protein n=1 Tax=Sinanodonta woodiana TaxID=1069815 RepID=A0ABD3VY41_SINWO
MLKLKLVAIAWNSELIACFGKRPYKHITALVTIKKESTETYRGLMARINQHIKRLLDDPDPFICLNLEYFVKAFPQYQSQWVRRNNHSSQVVKAARERLNSHQCTTTMTDI